MAKQSGLHQIRGKVGEHSYYNQTGVESGLIRSINQGMSSRVKTAEEYANTRLNNVEFGGAANVAGLLGKMVVPKFRPMILPFSQSKMAKSLLALARQSTLAWGKRTLQATDTPEIAAILSAQSKRDYTEFVSVEVDRTSATEASLTASYTAAQGALMAGLGINKLQVVGYQVNLATGKYNNVTGKIQNGYIRFRDSKVVCDEAIDPTAPSSSSQDIVVSSFTPSPETFTGHQLVVFVVMPIRTIANVDNILQEYCSFVALELPAYGG